MTNPPQPPNAPTHTPPRLGPHLRKPHPPHQRPASIHHPHHPHPAAAAGPRITRHIPPPRCRVVTTPKQPGHKTAGHSPTRPHARGNFGLVNLANVAKHVTIGHENGPRRSLRGPFPLVAGTGFEPATSGL